MGKKSASQASSSWRSRCSRVLTKNEAPLPSFNRSSAMSALPERGQVARLRVEQGALAIPDGVDHHQVAVPTVQGHQILPPPRQQPVRRTEQPAVQVPDKQDTVRDRRKAPGELLWGIGRAVEVPKVFNLVRVEPGFDMGEQAAVGLQVGLQ